MTKLGVVFNCFTDVRISFHPIVCFFIIVVNVILFVNSSKTSSTVESINVEKLLPQENKNISHSPDEDFQEIPNINTTVDNLNEKYLTVTERASVTLPNDDLTTVTRTNHENASSWLQSSDLNISVSNNPNKEKHEDYFVKVESYERTTTDKPSTGDLERISKTLNENDKLETLFQFWTTLSGITGRHTNVQTSVDFEDESTKNPTSNGDARTELVTESDGKINSSQNDDVAKNADLDTDRTEESFTEYFQMFDETTSYSDSFVNSSRLDENYLDAANYGMMKMNELYVIQEPKLYQMGLVLDKDDPARYVAAFNWQSEEAKNISKFGYASVQAYMYLHDRFSDELESRTADQDEEEGEIESEEVLPKPPRPSPPRSSTLRQQCPLKNDPRCPPASKRYRTHDGTCNNFRRLRWGSALSAVQRFLPPEYGDGVQSERRSRSGGPLPSARAISEAVHTPRNEDESSEAPVTHMLMQWGQFLDHDITSSSQARGFNGSIPKCCDSGGREFIPREFLHPECMPIAVPKGDSFYGTRGIQCLEFIRSSPAPRSGCEFGYREQLNQVTAYIDGSPVYSSSARQSDKLRLFRNGMLQYGRVQARRPVLPPDVDDEEELCRGGAVDASCFKAGDGRVNEHPGLVAMHIVWLRKHNRLATELSHINPHWSDEKVYQETRKIIGAFIQHITYREFLPIVLGPEVMKLFDLQLREKGYFKGYSSKVNPSPANAFGAAAFRFGHSLVQDSFMRYDRFHRPIHNNVALHKELTNPSNIWSFGAVDRLLLGLTNQPSQKRDEFISPELTNHLFQTSRFSFGMDLAAINIQRGRDHGIPAYVQWREPCGLSAVLEWEDLLRIMPLRAVRNLESVYRNVEDIDLFTGGMAERPVIGGLVGPTFACIIAQQFANLRKGDRFWYENGNFESSFTPAQLQQIRKITLAQVLCQTMENVETLQPFVFLIPHELKNQRLTCTSEYLNNFSLDPWTERSTNFDNDISGSDFVKTKLTTETNTFTHQNINGLLSDSFTETNKKTTPKLKKTTTSRPIHLDDKLDTPLHDPISNNIITDFQHKTPILHTTRPTVTQHTFRPVLTTHRPANVILNDKLDFQSKTIRNNSLQSNINNNNNRQARSEKLSTATNDVVKQNADQKTFPFTEIPFYNYLLTNFMSTPVPTRKKPTRKQQIIVYQDDSTTRKPTKYTYLINIVPKTTTPLYDDKEVVKITVQADARPSMNQRPVYNNNRLEYRPSSYNDDLQNSKPQLNRPYNNIDKYDSTDSYYKPVSTYFKPYGSNSYDQDSSSNNYYSFSTFTNLETTTKRHDLFHRPLSNNNYNSYKPSKPSVTFSNDYNYNKRPSDHQTSKPSTAGITIYIDNKVQVRPSLQDDKYTDSYAASSSSSQSSEANDNTPLFTRPSYNRPLSQKPLTDYYGNKPSSTVNNNNDYYYQQMTENDNTHFPTWNQRPDPPNDYPSNDYNTYIPTHKEKPQSTKRRPIRPYASPRPSQVSLHVASEYGNRKPGNISIVINPFLEYKSNTQSESPKTTKQPTKYYYIKNVLYSYPNSDDPLSSKTFNSSKTNRKDEIIKENYNNPWNPNSSDNNQKMPNNLTEGILKSKSNVSPSNLNNNVESKQNDNELLDLSSGRNDQQQKNTATEKIKQVFFDVIPSENSPTRWIYYKEKPENPSLKIHMPVITSDPFASKELPRPIHFEKFNKIFKKINQKS